MKITQKVEEFPSFLSEEFNKMISFEQPVPKGNPFSLTFKTLPEDEYPEFRNTGRRVSEVEANTPF